jgi:hypothetical protein
VNWIRELRANGLEPRIDVVRHGIETEREALLLEAALIDSLPDLTNKVSSYGIEFGRAPLSELVTRYGAQLLEASDPPVLMIRLTPRWIPLREKLEPGYFRMGAGWYPDASSTELFDAVRGWWKGQPDKPRSPGVRHVIAVVEGVTRGIYEIDQWYPLGFHWNTDRRR